MQAKVRQQTRSIKRTIIIGLGGTGRDTIMRIRRFIIDEYGKLDNLPVVSFVHIDTDKNAFTSSGLPTGNLYHGEGILLQSSETVAMTMSARDIDALRYEFDHRGLGESPYSNIESWFNPQLKDKVTAIENGANGIRSIGRLAFFHNYRKIKAAVDAADIRTRGHEEKMFQQKFNVESGLDIFVVGSLCGGTGSGTFLDMAYALKHIYENTAQVFGYLVVSPSLYGDSTSMKANTYAALKELNHYMTEGNSFVACYDKQNHIVIDEARQPFAFTYLVSNRTAGGYLIYDKSKLCNIIAYKIFLEISSELASAIRRPRDNFKSPMYNKVDEHPFGMCQGYVAFGLGSIYFTRDRVVKIALNRLTERVIQFWLEGYGQSPDVVELLNEFLIGWKTDSNKDYITVKLEESSQDNNKNFNRYLSSWKNNLEKEIDEGQNLDELKQIVKQSLEKEFRKVQPGETEQSRGSWLTICQRTRGELVKKFKIDIDEYVGKLLNPNSSNFSISNTLAFLESFKSKLNSYKIDANERLQGGQGLQSAEKIEKIWKDTAQVLEDLDKKRSLIDKVVSFSSKAKHLEKLKLELKDYVKKGQKLIQNNFDYTIALECRNILESLEGYIDRRIEEVYTFNQNLKEIKSYYVENEKQIRQSNIDEMTGEGIFPEDEIDGYIADGYSRNTYVSISQSLINSYVGSNSILSFFDSSFEIEQEELQKGFNQVIEKSFQTVTIRKTESVIQKFLGKYPNTDRSRRLGQILESTEPLLSININDRRFYHDNQNVSRIIGYRHNDDLATKQFREILETDLGISDTNTTLEPTQEEDRVLFIQEFAGFPLRLVTDLEPMRSVYQQQLQNNVLHNDYRIPFADIIPPDALDIERLEYLLYPCIGFNLLRYNPATRMYDFDCYDSLLDEYYTASISDNWRLALEQLVSRRDMANILQENLDKVKHEIIDNPRVLEDKYNPIIKQFIKLVDSLPENHPNFKYKVRVIGQRATDRTPAKEGVITRYINQIKEEIVNLKRTLGDLPADSSGNYTGSLFLNSSSEKRDR